jgi:hypothetical protein
MTVRPPHRDELEGLHAIELAAMPRGDDAPAALAGANREPSYLGARLGT